MKRYNSLILILITVIITGCTHDTTILFEESTENTTNVEELIITTSEQTSVQTIETSTVETETVESIYVPDYEVMPMDFDLSFDDVFNTWIEYIGVDLNSIVDGDTVTRSVDYNDYHINYEPDYQTYVQHMSVPDSNGYNYFNPTEADYHIIRYLRVDNLILYDFDSQEWAEEGFRSLSNEAVISNTVTDDSSLTDGYCFIYRTDPHGSYYNAFYYWDNYVMHYSYNFVYGSSDSYDRYIDLCEVIGLPTSDYITTNYFDND